MQNKGMYVVIGILIGIIIVLALVKIPGQFLYAVDPTNSDSGNSDGVIALTTNTISTQATVLWVLDTKKSNLLVYEFANDNMIELKAFRDVKYDMDIPDGYAGFVVPRKQSPLEVQKAFKDAQKKLRPPEKKKKK